MQKHTIKSRKTKKEQSGQQKIQSIISSNQKSIIKTAKGRKLSSSLWINRAINDPFSRAAKKDLYLSRAAYKLMEMQDHYKIFRVGQTVLDLGAAPGGWMQIIWDKIRSNQSRLIGVDLLPIQFSDTVVQDNLSQQITTIMGDFNDPIIQEQILVNAPNGIDVICSDIAPNTIGNRNTDHLAIVAIIENIMSFSTGHLNEGGSLILKLFQGREQNDILTQLKKDFQVVKFFKPQASYKNSSEMYILALNKKQQKL